MRLTLRNVIIGLVLALAVGLAGGWFLGRWALERSWSQPMRVVSAQDFQQSSPGADPTPAVGTKIFVPMPLARARVAVRALTEHDPLVMTVGAIGRNGIKELHLVLENHGTCTITGYAGVAYGFDAWGRPAGMNRNGEHYVAVRGEAVSIPPGEHSIENFVLRFPTTPSLAVAHVDHTECADGSTWSRN